MKESFYECLFNDSNFCQSLGHLVLSSAKLETSLKLYMSKIDESNRKKTLGFLINKLVQDGKINRTALEHLKFILHERNFFIHNLHWNLKNYPSNFTELNSFVSRVDGVVDEMEFFSDILIELSKK